MLSRDYGVFVSINVMRMKCSIQHNNCKCIRLQIQVLYYCAFEFIAWNKRIFAKIALLSFQIGFKFQWNDVILFFFHRNSRWKHKLMMFWMNWKCENRMNISYHLIAYLYGVRIIGANIVLSNSSIKYPLKSQVVCQALFSWIIICLSIS